MQRQPEMTTAVASVNTSRSVSTPGSESSAPTWGHICWRNHEWCFRWAHKCVLLWIFHWLALIPLLTVYYLWLSHHRFMHKVNLCTDLHFRAGLSNRHDTQHIKLQLVHCKKRFSGVCQSLQSTAKSHSGIVVSFSHISLISDSKWRSCGSILVTDVFVVHEHIQSFSWPYK